MYEIDVLFNFPEKQTALYLYAKNPLTLQPIVILFFAAILIQLSYFIIFAIALNRKGMVAKSISPKTDFQPVSILVCAHDEEQNLRELIPLLLKQNYSEFELVVINDRSNDGTYDYLLEEGPSSPR